MLNVVLLVLAFALSSPAQQPTILPPGGEAAVMVPQPPVEVSPAENVSATAEFDPPVTVAGRKFFYRVNVTATQNAIRWPDEISTPPGLKFTAVARGQLTQPDGVKAEPVTSFVYEVAPAKVGRFTVPAFTVRVGERNIEVPAASLEVLESGSTAPAARRLVLEFSETNIFDGQPVEVRVISPAVPGTPLAALRDVQFSGGVFVDKLSIRMNATAVNLAGQPVPAFIYGATAFPLAAGPCDVSAQGFTVSLFSAGPIIITAGGGPVTLGGAQQVKAVLLTSDMAHLNVRPLPSDKELPGFTGAMGKFLAEKPSLSTNKIHVGEPVKLKFGFTAGTNLTRFVPPAAPRSREWQIIEGKPGENVFTLIPLTDEVTNTPAIPFCAFDFAAGKFYDLTIPAQVVAVVSDGLPVQLAGWDEKAAPLKLSGLAGTPGKTVLSLKPLQTQPWFIGLQLVPVYLLFLLWQWDQRRRFFEAHPEIVRRNEARRALKRERKLIHAAVIAADEAGFVTHAAVAMRVAVAPHFPADARALVGADVLSQLDPAQREGSEGETVRKVFAAADARFGSQSSAHALLNLADDVESVLRKLEDKL